VTRAELEKRLHAAVEALSGLERDDGINNTVADISFHGCAAMLDVVGDLGKRYEQRHVCSVEGGEVRYEVAEAVILGVGVDVYGPHLPEDQAAGGAEPAPESGEGAA